MDPGSVVVAISAGCLVPLILAACIASYLSPKVDYAKEPQLAKDQDIRYPVILGIAHGNPPYKVPQTEALKLALGAKNIDSVKPLLERMYRNTKINSRYLSVPDFFPETIKEGDSLLFNQDGLFQLPVEKRLDRFRKVAVPLVTNVAKQAIQQAGVSVQDIQKLVVVSSTGFLGPGLDCALIDQLGLKRSVDRTLIGFMGCAAAMNGFRVANDFVRAERNSGKYALLVCVEISSVHTTFEDNMNDAILHAIFADGCAAAVLGGISKSEASPGTLAIVDEYSWLCENAEDGITLSINANGISCTLSKDLSKYIAANMPHYIDTFLSRHKLSKQEVDFWGVHPGGTRIIEAVEKSVHLTRDQTADSWAVLGEYGNMLSPSIMYVLARVFKRHREMRLRGEQGHKLGLAFSFSPGVGVEGIMLRQI
jgi:alpha-pyrone synthase